MNEPKAAAQTPGHALVTGGAGFIGSHLVDGLLADGWTVTVVDNFDPYYAESTKRLNIAPHLDHRNYRLLQVDLRDAAALHAALDQPFGSADKTGYTVIVHLAAKAGVRNSLLDPLGYQMTNVIGTQNLLTYAYQRKIKQFVFASSSSVYGAGATVPQVRCRMWYSRNSPISGPDQIIVRAARSALR